MSKSMLQAGFLAVVFLGSAALAQTPAAPATPAPAPAMVAATPNDYANADNWLCLPGKKASACDVNLDTTVVAADGSTTIEQFEPAKDPKIDCFYVYPTVSRDPGIVSTMNAGPEELAVVAVQFARFGAVCRQFAPLYRQFTLTALAARMAGKPMDAKGVDPRMGYNDVVNAWNYYLAHYNNGRGVVLIGHSQGSGVLTQLIKNEIDGKPVQNKIVSALLMGTRLQVPAGKDVGGAFQNVPLCHSSSQTGCAIAYASFRATTPPTATTLFGKSEGPGLEAACVNPAALGGGSGEAHAYLNNRGAFNGTDFSTSWSKGKTVTTNFVSVPGMLTAECGKTAEGNTYLGITIHADPNGPRVADIRGDVVVGGQVNPNWGLHLIDANLFMGNLIDIVRDQTKAYAGEKH
jgi:hypothetical protein